MHIVKIKYLIYELQKPQQVDYILQSHQNNIITEEQFHAYGIMGDF